MIRLKTSISVLDNLLSLNNIRGVMINSQSNFKIIILLKFINVNYNEMMYKIGLGMEVSSLNPFIKAYYEKMKLDELNEAEINVLGSIENSTKLVNACKENLEKKNILESEKELLLHTIEDTEYQINTSKEIIILIQSLKVKERNKKAKK